MACLALAAPKKTSQRGCVSYTEQVTSEITIQPVVSTDLPDIITVHKAAYAKAYINSDLGITEQLLHDHVYDDQYDRPSFGARLDEYHSERSTRDANTRYVIARLGTTIVGYATTLRKEPGGFLDGLYVHPDQQGAGIGRLLLRDAEAFARGPLSLYVVEHAPAFGFYISQGYRRTNGPDFHVPLVNGPYMKLVELSNSQP